MQLGPIKVRYMPQAEGVFMDLTLQENVLYFGRLGGFGERRIFEIEHIIRYNVKTNFVNVQMKYLNQSHRRLASFFIGFLGYPDVYVLDDPTELMDPESR